MQEKNNKRRSPQGDKRDRNFVGLLYDDSDSYDFFEVLNNIQNIKGFYNIVKHSPLDKKEHYHFLIRFNDAKTISSVSKIIGIEPNYIEICKDVRKATRYLIHKDNPEKEQILIDNVISNDINLHKYCLNENDEGDIVLEILSWLDQGKSFRDCLKLACAKGYYSQFRRNFGILHTILTDERK